MAAVTVASVIVLFFLPLGVIGNAAGQPYYDYLQFVLQYPRTVNPISKFDNFTIHGLWPANWSNPYVIDCGPNITITELRKELNKTAGLRNKLLHSWPNVKTPKKPERFWRHEYNKHGTCTKLIFTEPQAYFKKADDLYRTPPLDNLFTRIGIPTGELVDTRTFKNRVQNATGGKRPRLWCSKTNKTLLQEVVICYNKNATKVINCSLDTGGRNCWGNISYPKEIALGQLSVEAGAARRGPSYMVSMVLFFSLALGLIIYKYGPSYIKSKLA